MHERIPLKPASLALAGSRSRYGNAVRIVLLDGGFSWRCRRSLGDARELQVPQFGQSL